jgi:hypothetical protein
MLNGQPEPKNLVRSVFGAIVTTPPQTFGSVTSNLPRVRQSELLTPAELMVVLHESEKEIGLNSAKEGIAASYVGQRNSTEYFDSNLNMLLNDGCISFGNSRSCYATNHGRACDPDSIYENREFQWRAYII